MLCDICKEKEAVIHIHQISAAGKKIINLCNDCAEKHSQGELPFNIDSLNFSDIIENIKKISADLIKQHDFADNSPVCPKCGWDMHKMEENNGLLGCDKCYETFNSVVLKTVNNIHRSEIHVGKRPKNSRHDIPELRREKLRKLENELRDAVAKEEYEHAAVIRDEIAALKKKRKKESAK